MHSAPQLQDHDSRRRRGKAAARRLDAKWYPLLAQLLDRLERAGLPYEIKAQPAPVRVLVWADEWRCDVKFSPDGSVEIQQSDQSARPDTIQRSSTTCPSSQGSDRGSTHSDDRGLVVSVGAADRNIAPHVA
jgi:hypothetical protein